MISEMSSKHIILNGINNVYNINTYLYMYEHVQWDHYSLEDKIKIKIKYYVYYAPTYKRNLKK